MTNIKKSLKELGMEYRISIENPIQKLINDIEFKNIALRTNSKLLIKIKKSETNDTCTVCHGHKTEICDNPDHGFIDAFSFTDIGRIGCPGCGHDRFYRVKDTICPHCEGTGIEPYAIEMEWNYY